MSLIERVSARMQAKFDGECTGHDWHHIRRVKDMALRLAKQEGACPTVTALGALLHDIADWKFHDGNDERGPAMAKSLLEQEGVAPEMINQVVDIVATISFKGAGVPTPMKSLEGQCVQDADRLDALGAIGIARCFAYGGHKGRQIFDPAIPPVLHQSAESYKAATGTSLNHFHEKLLLLKDRMNTASGKALAEERHRYMQGFVDQFMAEWQCAN